VPLENGTVVVTRKQERATGAVAQGAFGSLNLLRILSLFAA
jgi:hypothetical protein